MLRNGGKERRENEIVYSEKVREGKSKEEGKLLSV